VTKESSLSTYKRESSVKQLSSQTFDLLVIGGGITGAGIALDAASRGLSVALVDKNDFASGTSSKSTKLIHGGLRYLKQFEIGLVKEVGRERAILHKNAPHVVFSEICCCRSLRTAPWEERAPPLACRFMTGLRACASANGKTC
jgi:glycerol-3-phosphate dehydrogenase